MQLQTDIKYIKESLINNDNQHKEIINKIDSIIQTFDNRYAPIRTWTIIVWTSKIIGTAIILGLIALVAHAYKVL